MSSELLNSSWFAASWTDLFLKWLTGPSIEGYKDIPTVGHQWIIKTQNITKSLYWRESLFNDRMYHLDQNTIVNFCRGNSFNAMTLPPTSICLSECSAKMSGCYLLCLYSAKHSGEKWRIQQVFLNTQMFGTKEVQYPDAWQCFSLFHLAVWRHIPQAIAQMLRLKKITLSQISTFLFLKYRIILALKWALEDI